MSIRPLAAWGLLCLMLPAAGCGRVVGSGAARPSQSVAVSLIAGGVAVVDPGTQGYLITASAGSFRFTWQGYDEFRGSLFADPGAIGTLTPGCRDSSCALADGDVVRASSEAGRIDFLGTPGSGQRGGFDVAISSNLVLIDLLVDGKRHPELTWFAALDDAQRPYQATAATMPISLQIALPTAVPERPVVPAQIGAFAPLFLPTASGQRSQSAE